MQKLLKETGANLISGHIRPINEETIDPMIAYHTHVFVKNPLKDVMIAVCEEEGLTQAQFIERLLERELTAVSYTHL